MPSTHPCKVARWTHTMSPGPPFGRSETPWGCFSISRDQSFAKSNTRIVSNQRRTIENVPCVNENESMVKVNNEGPKVQQSCDSELSKDRYILIGLRGNRKPIHLFESMQEMPLWKVLKYQEWSFVFLFLWTFTGSLCYAYCKHCAAAQHEHILFMAI